MKKILRVGAMLLLALGLVGGCGQGAGEAKKPVDGTPVQGGADKQTTPAAESDFKVEKLVIGMDDSFAPMGFRDEKGEIVGFDIDLAKEVAKRLKCEVSFQPIDWASKEMELESGNVSCLWNGFSITPDRLAAMEMSKPYIANTQMIMIDPKSNIKTKADLTGKEIGVQAQSSALDAINGDPLKKQVSKISEYPQNVDAFNDLKAGRLAAVVADEILVRYYLATDAYKNLALLEDQLAAEEYGIGFKKGNTQLRDAVQGAMDAMIKDGTAAEISTKWFGKDIMIKK